MGGRSIIDEKFIQNISGHSSLENIKSSLWKSLQLKNHKLDVHCLLGDQGILKYWKCSNAKICLCVEKLMKNM
jgi:hypothetical protein